ncbi:MAG: protein phosphatase 2C domain-containing protein [Paracoccus sp. (in: a-proteobacteria)]|nr:protein phosphatase 2C domain-containing protein [Paracoccus sp. (in: a-proteobacteria)]
MSGGHDALRFHTAALTHEGLVRRYNEDAFASIPELSLWVVADGMGGHAAGDIASRIIVEELASIGVPISAEDQRIRFRERLDRAHRRIRSYAAENRLDMVGATVAALMVYGTELTCGWAGDSRIYLLRKGSLTALSRDHSEVAELLAQGTISEAEARNSPRRNVILRAIGIGQQAEPELATGVAEPGDRFLICSDGLTEHLQDDEIARVMSREETPEAVADNLVALTLDRGAKDNVTVVVIDASALPDAFDSGE